MVTTGDLLDTGEIEVLSGLAAGEYVWGPGCAASL